MLHLVAVLAELVDVLADLLDQFLDALPHVGRAIQAGWVFRVEHLWRDGVLGGHVPSYA